MTHLLQAAEMTAIIVPLALYFGFLGLVNIRRRPTVVSGRLDFVVVIIAFLPLLYRPLSMVIGLGGVAWQASIFLAVAVILWLLLPREFTSWVVYSVSREDVTQCLELILHRLKISHVRRENRIDCQPPYGSLVISNMPLLRNVTVYVEGSRETAFFERLGEELQRDLGKVASQPSLSGHCFLAVAATLLLTPLVVMAHEPVLAFLRRWLAAG